MSDQSKKQNDVFSQLMFNGRQKQRNDQQPTSTETERASSSSIKEQQTSQLQSTIMDRLNNANLDELFGHVDTLMTSVNELKPLYKKMSPFIDKFISKKGE